MFNLTDVSGSRLSGSTNLNNAQIWAKKQLTDNWNFVRALVGELVAKGSVDEVRFSQIEKGYSKSRINILDTNKDRILPDSQSSVKMCKSLFGG